MEQKPIHVCLGRCHAEVSDEQFAAGLVACGNDVCEKKGALFAIGYKCHKCGKTYKKEEHHICGT